MGLDMYLLKRTGNQQTGSHNELTGACGGLFPWAPSNKEEDIEIGYWRKAYSVNDYLVETILQVKDYGEFNLKKARISKANVIKVIKEAEFRLEEDYFKDNWEKQDWEDTKRIFNGALEAIEKEQAKIYYQIWY